MTHSPDDWDYEGVYASSCGHPCTPDGCHDSHFSGYYALIGPDFIDDCGEEIVVYMRDEKQARVIAGAHDMLSALKFAQAMYDKWLKQRWVHLEPDVSDEINDLWKVGQAAISKAEGIADGA